MNGHHNPKKGNRRRSILIVVVMVSVVLLLIAQYVIRDAEKQRLFSKSTGTAKVQTEEQDDPYADDSGLMTYFNGQWYQQKQGLETLLVIGLDKTAEYAQQEDSYRNTQQADFLMLMVFDRKNEELSVVHINRDTMAQLLQLDVNGNPMDTVEGQLALSHTYGANEAERCQYTIRAVSQFLYGTHIDHYISFTMDAVPIVNDLCGGVTVELMDDFTDVDETFTQGATVTLHGEQSLRYVRARGGLADPTNVHRMERQRQYLDALADVMRERAAESGDFIENAVSELSEYLHSDCTILQLSRYAEYALDDEYDGIETIEGETVQGETYIEFYPDETKLKEQIIRLFYTPAK